MASSEPVAAVDVLVVGAGITGIYQLHRAVVACDDPAGVVVVPPRRGHAGAVVDVAPEVDAVDHVVEVALGLGLLREVLLPLPLVEELLREQVAVRVALRVEPCLGVAVPVPGATDATTGLEQLHGETCFTRAIQLVDARDAGADDQHVDLGRVATRALVGCGSGGLHCTDRLV